MDADLLSKARFTLGSRVRFRAHDPLTGNVLWTLNLNWNWDGYSMNTVPAIDSGMAFIQQRPNLIAIDLTSHANVWTATGGVRGSPAVANGIVYAIIGDGVQAFSARTARAWGFTRPPTIPASPGSPSSLMTRCSCFIVGYLCLQSGFASVDPDDSLRGHLVVGQRWLYISGQDGWLRAYTVPTTNSPEIMIQPANLTVTVGDTAVFSMAASGALPMHYQWLFNGTNLSRATNTSLTLTNVQLNQAGYYAMVVTNLYGSAISSNAVLTVNLPPPCTPAPSGLVSWWPVKAMPTTLQAPTMGRWGWRELCRR